jgi:hypothetical protein
MQTNWWLSLFSSVELATLSCVVYLMVHNRMLAKWPCLFIMLWLEMLTDVGLLSLIAVAEPWHIGRFTQKALPHAYRYYFYLYWYSLAIRSLFHIGVMADMMRTFKEVNRYPFQRYLLAAVAALGMAGYAGFISYHSGAKPIMRAQETALLLNEAASLAWGVFAVFVLATIRGARFRWNPFAARLMNGLFARICGSMLVAYLCTQSSRQIRLFANGLDSFCSIAVFTYWMILLTMPKTSNGLIESLTLTGDNDPPTPTLRKMARQCSETLSTY